MKIFMFLFIAGFVTATNFLTWLPEGVTRIKAGVENMYNVDRLIITDPLYNFYMCRGGVNGCLNPIYDKRFCNAVARLHEVFYIPEESLHFMILDTMTNNFIIIKFADTTEQGFSAGILGPDGNKIYCVPYYKNKIGVLDTITRTYSSIELANLQEYTYYGGVLGLGNILYFVPWIGRTRTQGQIVNSLVTKFTEIGVFDITTAQYSTIDISGMQISGQDQRHYNKATLAPDGSIYFFPYRCNQILILYPNESNRIQIHLLPRPSWADRPPLSITDTPQYSGGVLAPNGKIFLLSYKFPHYRLYGVLNEYNLATGLLTQILPGNMTTIYYGQHVLAMNGLIYIQCRDKSYLNQTWVPGVGSVHAADSMAINMIAEVDPSTNLVRHIHFPPRLKTKANMDDYTFWYVDQLHDDNPNFVIANNGVLYGVPNGPQDFGDYGVIAFSHPFFCAQNGYGVKHRRLGYNFCCPELSRLDTNGESCTCSENSEINIDIQGNEKCSCSSGFEKDSMRACTACKLGYYRFGLESHQCVACSVGTYSNTTASSSCIKCGEGTYANTTVSSSCIKCGEGKYADTIESSSCIKCDVGKYLTGLGSTKRSDCISCEPGKYQDEKGSSFCKICPFEYASGPNFQECVLCEIGTYWNLETYKCQPCNISTYKSQAGSSQCQGCVGNTGFINSFLPCQLLSTPCFDGYYYEGIYCVKCPQNKTTPRNTLGLIHFKDSCACKPGYEKTSVNTCVACRVGFYSPVVGSLCISSPPGNFVPYVAMSNYIKCPLRFVSTIPESTFCTPCPWGTISNQQNTICIPDTTSFPEIPKNHEYKINIFCVDAEKHAILNISTDYRFTKLNTTNWNMNTQITNTYTSFTNDFTPFVFTFGSERC